MQQVLLTINLIVVVFLIAAVLLQRSEGGALGMGGGGGGGVVSGRGAATALQRATWWLGGAFIVLSIALTALAARDSGGASILDNLPAATEQAPATPETFVPPTLGQEPAAPTANQ